MGLTLQRTIYTHSDVQIMPTVLAGGAPGGALLGWGDSFGAAPNHEVTMSTVQNATFTLNIPRADVNVFGLQGVLDRPQLEAETATLEFGFIPEICGSPAVTHATMPAGMNWETANLLIKDTIDNAPQYVSVMSANVGAVARSLMNSFSGEGSVGALPTFTMSFTGANKNSATPHNPETAVYPALAISGVAQAAVTTAPVISSSLTSKAKIVTPKDINLRASCVTAGETLLDETVTYPPASGTPAGTTEDNDTIIESCAQSVSFAWDVPVETILCLGGDPVKDGIALGNPPGTASFTVEALSSQLNAKTVSQNYQLLFGHYLFELANGNIDSRTHNLAVGDLYGSYNYVIGGTGDGFKVSICCT